MEFRDYLENFTILRPKSAAGHAAKDLASDIAADLVPGGNAIKAGIRYLAQKLRGRVTSQLISRLEQHAPNMQQYGIDADLVMGVLGGKAGGEEKMLLDALSTAAINTIYTNLADRLDQAAANHYSGLKTNMGNEIVLGYLRNLMQYVPKDQSPIYPRVDSPAVRS